MTKKRTAALILLAGIAAAVISAAIVFMMPQTLEIRSAIESDAGAVPLTLSLKRSGGKWAGVLQIGDAANGVPQRADVADVSVRKIDGGHEYTLFCIQIVAVGDGYKLTELPGYTVNLGTSPHFYAAFGHYAGTYEISADDFKELERCK